MNTIENTNTKTNEYSVYLSELVKGTPYEQDFINIDSYNNEELIIKIKALILKTKYDTKYETRHQCRKYK